MSLEFSFLRTPVELLNKSVRNRHKIFEKDISHVISQVDEIQKAAKSPTEAAASIQSLIGKLQGMKRKISNVWHEDEQQLERYKLRLDHLEAHETSKNDKEALHGWCKTRLNRYLAEYLLREGYTETAKQLIEQQELQNFVDSEIFISSKAVIEGLIRHDCTEALKWCADNRARLKKIECCLEFELRLQEYVELVRSQALEKAITYAKKHLASCYEDHPKDVQRGMALLAFSSAESSPYHDLLDVGRWEHLISEYKLANYQLHFLSRTPLLTLTLRAGISALKTPHCEDKEGKNVNCPVCDDVMCRLGADLPLTRHSQSSLICRVTGEIMNEDNPPMMLPNGQVYSLKALEAITIRNNGLVICPKTGDVCNLADLRKVFIS